ncbi:hypothetical protein [Salipaludibacillus sp. CF4.18]|uniref:hypothetical protein n=1 Tax=Salipaludibacillus sp. CF4.18 TaxID=3373081 RepID=UPI003EE75DE7
MIALSSLHELYSAKNLVEQLKVSQPSAYNKLLDVISLTRQMQINYQGFGTLLMDENEKQSFYGNIHIRDSVLQIFYGEVDRLKNDSNFEDVKLLFSTYKEIGYTTLCKLILGESPESLKGVHQGNSTLK